MKFVPFFLLLIVLTFVSNTFAQLDTTFNNTGIKLIQFGSAGAPSDMVVQPDNKIVLAGDCNNIGTIRLFCTIRLNEDGSLDTLFGNGTGYVYPVVNGQAEPFGVQGVALQKDGKIVLAGQLSSALYMIRLNTNGSNDPTFGTVGSVQNLSITASKDVAIQPDGKILVVGYSGTNASNYKLIVARYLTDATLDNSFGVNGVASLANLSYQTVGYSLDIQPDGKIVAGGSTSLSTTILARFNRDGSLDPTFDGDGIVTVNSTTNQFPNLGNFTTVKIKSDGKIVGLSDPNLIYSFNADGSLDTNFDGDGSIPAIPNCDVYDLDVSASGRILVGGNPPTSNFPDVHFRSIAYLSNGMIDPNFPLRSLNLAASDGVTAVLFDRKARAFLGGRASNFPNIPFITPAFAAVRYTAPATQNVGFSGKVTNLNGKPLLNALITLKVGDVTIANARTNPFGNFRFQNVPTNQTYTVTTVAKGKKFYDREVTLDDVTTNFLIVGE